jgi:hypothetical protein
MKAIKFEWTVLNNGVKRIAFWRLSHGTFRDAEASSPVVSSNPLPSTLDFFSKARAPGFPSCAAAELLLAKRP